MLLRASTNYEVMKRALELAIWKQRQIDEHNAMLMKLEMDQ